MVEKTQLKYLRKEGYDFVFEEIESGEEVTLKIWKDKPFKNNIAFGEIGYGVLNSNWLNEWQKLKDADKKLDEVTSSSTPKVISPYDDKQNKILAQSTLKEAVNIAIANNAPDVTLKDIMQIHKELYDYMSNEGYKNETNTKK